MGRRVVLAVLLATAGLSGCVGGDEARVDDASDRHGEDDAGDFVPTAPEEDFTDRLPVWHPDHANPDSHPESYGLDPVGHTDMTGVTPPTAQAGWTDVDIHGDLAAVASMKGQSGVTLVDISDPSDPKPLSFIPSGGDDWDARFGPRGDHLFFGCDGSRSLPYTLATDCGGQTPAEVDPSLVTDRNTTRFHGVVAYDVTEPEDPELAGLLGGVSTHNLYVTGIDGTTYVFTDGTQIIRFEPSRPVGGALEQVGQLPGVHDVMVERHPVTGQWLLYTGASPGFAIFNVTDPTHPEVLVESGPVADEGWHEQTVSEGLVDGRVLLVVAGEDFRSPPPDQDGRSHPSSFTILDVTDPTQPQVLSTWTIPVTEIPPFTHYRFSPHNVDISPSGQVAVAFSHAGTWVFDLSTQDRQEDPVTLGFHQVHEEPVPRAPPLYATGAKAIPYTWTAAFDTRGYLVVPDMYTGLSLLEPSWGLFPDAQTSGS